jgi:hypothetical protein
VHSALKNQNNSPLLRLPAELRNAIYAYAFDHATAIYYTAAKYECYDLGVRHDGNGLPLACRQLHREAQPYVGTHQHLTVYGRPRFLSDIPLSKSLSKQGRRDLVKSIVVERTPYPFKLEDLDQFRQIIKEWPALRHLVVWGDFSCVGQDLFRDRFEQLVPPWPYPSPDRPEQSVSNTSKLILAIGDLHSRETWIEWPIYLYFRRR